MKIGEFVLDIKIDEGAALIVEKIEECGFEAFVVGGCVRDSIMGRSPHDWDITTSATPSDIMDIFDNTIPTGIKHGTVTVLLKCKQYEVTTYRVDGEYLDFRRPEYVTFTSNLIDDLARRDFTINAMAYSPSRGFVDVFGGLEDIGRKIIRCVGEPELRFNEDALRMIRAIRFSAQLGFDIDLDTQESISKNQDKISSVSAERINVEFEKIIKYNPSKLDNMYKLSGFVDKFFDGFVPGLENLSLASKVGDVIAGFGENFLSENFVDIDNLFLQDIKRAIVFQGMDVSGVELTMRRLRYSKKSIEKTLAISNILQDTSYDRYFVDGIESVDSMHIRVGIKYIMSRYKDLNIVKNVILAKIIQKNLKAPVFFRVYNDIIESGECFSISQMKINGSLIVDNNIAKGSLVGKILNDLLDHVIKNPSDNEESKLIEILKNIY